MFDYATHLRPRTRLVRRTIPIAIATVLVALAGLSLSGSVAASNSDEGVQGCTLATLKGRYLVADAGTLLPPAVPQPTLTAWAGFHVFNGDGTGHDIVTGRFDGQITLENVVAPISYSVNADCTGQPNRGRRPNLRSLHRARRRVHCQHHNRPRGYRGERPAAGVTQVERHS